jgi:hypothetical protein
MEEEYGKVNRGSILCVARAKTDCRNGTACGRTLRSVREETAASAVGRKQSSRSILHFSWGLPEVESLRFGMPSPLSEKFIATSILGRKTSMWTRAPSGRNCPTSSGRPVDRRRGRGKETQEELAFRELFGQEVAVVEDARDPRGDVTISSNPPRRFSEIIEGLAERDRTRIR